MLPACRTFNSRIQQYPAAIVYASTTADVAAAVSCATRYGVRVSPACGRQGFQGAAVPDGYLVVDVSNLDAVGGDGWLYAIRRSQQEQHIEAAFPLKCGKKMKKKKIKHAAHVVCVCVS